MTDAEAQGSPPSASVEDIPQPERKVIATLVQGTVKWFNVRNGYGFINRNDTKEDVFVHQTAIKKNNPRKFLRSVGDGEVVEFDVIEATKGSEAANVTGPGGVPVKGSRYAPNKRRFRRRFFPRSPRPGDKPTDGQSPIDESEGTGENGDMRPQQRRRRPRRPRQEGEAGEQRDGVAEDDQQTDRPQRRRFWRPYRRPFRPRPPPDQSAEGDQATAAIETQEQGEVKTSETFEASQTNGETAEGQDQKPPRQARRRRQRNSESSTSKNDTEKSASDPGTPPQTSKPSDLKSPSKSPKSSPKLSPKMPKSPEQTAAPTVPTPTE
ncbi:uncharacterized protein LOC143008102 [Genypterus blacodes]|uniref:uncharacterized protein LOC143008102 n=1 Tax=Genypterus blacodes TaxID=154954 RepID=UPI003F75F36B